MQRPQSGIANLLDEALREIYKETICHDPLAFMKDAIDRNTINELLTLRFIHNRENVVFLGPPGVGKTHLSVAIAMQMS